MLTTYSLRNRKLRNRILAAAVFALLVVPAGVPAHAVTKEMVQLETQVQQLLDMVQRLQSTVDSKVAGVQSLVQQTADQVNQMTAVVNTLQKQVQAQSEATGGKTDALSGQMQSLNDSVDEVKSRIAKLDKTIQDLQTQIQTMQSQPGGAQDSAPGTMPGNAPSGGAGGLAAKPAPGSMDTAPPLDDTFQAGLRDFNAAHYDLAAGEFSDVVHYYPLEDLAGTAQYYLGEIAYQQEKYADAVKFYDAVLTGFSGNSRAPAAQLHKGLALLALNKKDAGIRELRALIERHPQTPEAMKARSKLNGMGVKIVPTTAH
jgi:TolA-binding protein